MRKIFYFVCALLLMCCLVHQLEGSRQVKIQTPCGVLVVSKKEKQRLEYFFRDLIVYNCVGYTLLGNKPVSIDCMVEPCLKWDFSFLWNAYFPSNLKKYNGWKTFQKYQHFFCGKNFLIWTEPSPWIENGQLIVVASKKELDRIVRENQQDFKSNALNDLTVKPFLKDTLNSHDGLIGTVLGYGRDNSWLFFANRMLLPNTGAFSEEINQLFENKKASFNFTFGWPEVPMKEILMYPTFIAKEDSEETQALKSEYLETRNRILKYYAGKDFLEATLQLLSM